MGSGSQRVASADRLREERDRLRVAAEQRRRGIANSIAAVRRAELPSYTDEEETSQASIGKEGIKVKAPPWALLGLAVLALAAFLAWLRFR
jgi:hypothetical protein